ncbi:MAG: sensor histidine kinase [Jiangellaceae bacterium]
MTDGAGEKWRVLTADAPRGQARLWVSGPLHLIDDQLVLIRNRILLVGALTTVAAGAAGLVAGRWLTGPLRALRRRAAEISAGADADHAAMPRDAGIDEIDTLAATLDDLLASRDAQQRKTEEALQSARSFSATAAHELRTPMMSIKTNLDVLSTHPNLPASDFDEILGDLHGEHERMVNVLGMLRSLAQGELLDPSAFQLVDLADVVDQAVDAARRRLPEARVTMSAPDELAVRGWPEGLRLICDNLLTNAVVHGSADVTVSLRADGRGQAVLVVDDTGPGLTGEQRAAAFERFQRRPGSPGAGLGLTVTAQQVNLHGGDIELVDNPAGTGTRAIVRLPVPV